MQHSDRNPPNTPAALPEHVRASLKKYQKHTIMTCLECGYAGPMGVKQSFKPWYLSWWMLVVYAIVFAPLSWVFILVFVLAEEFLRKHRTECPNCGADLLGKEFV